MSQFKSLKRVATLFWRGRQAVEVQSIECGEVLGHFLRSIGKRTSVGTSRPATSSPSA